jgi:cardiolipin synthase
MIAKRLNQQSLVGSFLDPIADKTLMTVSAVALAMEGLLPGLCFC